MAETFDHPVIDSDGHTVELDAVSKSGSIKMGGVTFPISEPAPPTGRRREAAAGCRIVDMRTPGCTRPSWMSTWARRLRNVMYTMYISVYEL